MTHNSCTPRPIGLTILVLIELKTNIIKLVSFILIEPCSNCKNFLNSLIDHNLEEENKVK